MAPDREPSGASIEHVRASIVRTSLDVALIVGLPAWLASVIASFSDRVVKVAVFDTALLAWLFAIRFLPRLRWDTRAVQFVLLVHSVGAMLLFTLGPLGHGVMWLVGASVAAAALLSPRHARLALGAQIGSSASESALPGVRTFISFVVRMNRDSIRSAARSAANAEFHHTVDEVEETARGIVRVLNERGARAMNGAAGFPMEADRWPARMWIVAHKLVAVEAGLGRMGLHRNVIHPVHGSFVLLGTVLTDLEIEREEKPLDWDPCVSCKLCVAACPVGAIHSDGAFDVSACYTHNYREFMGGFIDWVEDVVESKSPAQYRSRTSDAETVSMWQSLSFGPSYKAAYCLAVCPAGEDVIGPFLANRAGFLDRVVRPLQRKEETIYVLPGSDAETFVTERHPHKRVKRVGNGMRPASLDALLRGMPLSFQRNKSDGLSAAYHFAFTGTQARDVTITIHDRAIRIEPGFVGTPDLHVTVDGDLWLRIVNGESTVLAAMLMRKLRVRGPIDLLKAFGACFPAKG